MKILFCLDDFPPVTYTSASTIVYNLAQELLKMGHEIFIITSVQDTQRESKEIYRGLKIFRIYSKYNVRWRFWINVYNPQTVFKFRKIIKEIKPDISHFHHIHQYLSYYCLKIAKKYSKAVFLTSHDVMLVHYGKLMPKNGNVYYEISVLDKIKEAGKRYNPFRNAIIRHYLKYVDKIFAVSDALKKVLEINGIKNVETIYNGINVDEWQVDLEEIEKFKKKYNLFNKKVILFGGRLSGAKGGEVILRAMSLVTKAIKNPVLLVAGEKDWYAEKMIKLAREAGIYRSVRFTGWLQREAMKCAFFASDVCITPSIYLDPFNLLNIEAGAAKKPVVGTCFGGTPEIVQDGITGYIVNPLDIKTMAAKIIDLLKNPQKAKQFGEAGYKRVKEKFSLEKQVKETLKWYYKYL